ncbi:MAG: carboxypeptidase regulatory-like domain-containing protein [Bacteroidetes bacterium]|nr:carboxypeptidase regulatory-like domain-containing protein [Bacteroidota bacterium]
MNRHQINELNMYDAVEQLFNANTSIWSGNSAMSATVATFISHVNAINANDTVQKTSSIGTTVSKQNAQEAMAIAAVAVANAGKAYATATSNAVLFDAMNHTKSEIMQASDTDADDICQNIHDNLNPYIANTTAYGATAASLTNLQNLINAFSALIGKPQLQKSIVTNATITLAQHFAAANALLKNQLDALMVQYQTSNAVFYNQYKEVRVINDIGHRHTVTLAGFVYDNHGHAISGATIVLSGGASHHKITNATGAYKFTRLHIGSFTLAVSASGFVTQTKNISVAQNETVHTDFTMVATGGGTNTNTPTSANTQ